jgi:hypothetical protein
VANGGVADGRPPATSARLGSRSRSARSSALCLCAPLVPFACARRQPWPLALLAACACASPGTLGELEIGEGREAESGCWALAGGGWPGTGGWEPGNWEGIRFSRTAVGLGWAGSLGRAAAGHLGLGQNDDCWTGETLGWRNCSGLRVPVGHPWVK